jgi:hypothetical protein
MIPGPTRAAILSCSIAGADMTNRVLKIAVFETVCKPYLTGTLVIRDDNNIINNLNIKGAEPVAFNFSAGDGLTYDQTLYILKVSGEPVNNNLRTVKYTIEMVSKEYYGDRTNMVQQSFQKQPGTAIAQSIHQRFLGSSLNVPVPSTGIIGEKNNYVVSSVKPIKAINDIRKIITFGGGSGASMFFRDRRQSNLVKVEHLFSAMGSQYSFEQKNTWGADWRNVLGAYNAILAASTSVNEKQGRGGGQASAMAGQFERKARDMFSTKKSFSDSISGGSGILSSVTGGHGGMQNFPIFDATKIQKENVRDTGKDAAYQSKVVDGPQITIKVPLQTGVLCTVGKGVTISLIPPTGDFYGAPSHERNNGNKLVADLCHEVEVGEHGTTGTTTMRLVSPPGT